MQIVSFQVSNYKSFRESLALTFGPGFNVIAGQNNIGKTALLEALSLRKAGSPHRSRGTVPSLGAPLSDRMSIMADLRMATSELHQILKLYPEFAVPHPEGATPEQMVARFREAIERDSVTLKFEWANGAFVYGYLESFGDHKTRTALMMRETGSTGQIEATTGAFADVPLDSQVGCLVANVLRDRIYSFNAQRNPPSSSPSGSNHVLAPDAGNLAEVLNVLQANPHRFRRYVGLVKSVFPAIHGLTCPPNANLIEIRIWSEDPARERQDLTFRLDESGTGIGQVLAMLYVVVNSDFPRLILIDEPQSFLHPSAARTLLGILKRYDQHQFIISTHSPTALQAADPNIILLLTKPEAETVVQEIDARDTRALASLLGEIGARPSDLFGAENVLWVEGRTEEECFPIILRRTEKMSLLGTSIIGVRSTDELEAKQAEAVFDIYERFSTKQVMLPPALALILDRETRSPEDMEKVRKRTTMRVEFTYRRMFENYLLNATAIANVMASIPGFRETPVTPADVEAWLERNRWKPEYFRPPPADESKGLSYSLDHVHGAALLHDVFAELSEARVDYRKVEHGVKLTEWICENAPDDFRELRELLKSVLPERTRAVTQAAV